MIRLTARSISWTRGLTSLGGPGGGTELSFGGLSIVRGAMSSQSIWGVSCDYSLVRRPTLRSLNIFAQINNSIWKTHPSPFFETQNMYSTSLTSRSKSDETKVTYNRTFGTDSVTTHKVDSEVGLNNKMPYFLYNKQPYLKPCLGHSRRYFSMSKKGPKDEKEPVGTWAKLKQMVKDYWYVIIPVEVGTSVLWYASIYLSLQSGLDIVGLLEQVGAGEATLARLPSAEAGYHALAFICYKVISPLRHGLSLAISSVVVAKLEKSRPGYLKTSGQLNQGARDMYDNRKDLMDKMYDDAWEKYADKKDNFKEMYSERKDNFKEMYSDKKDDFKERKEEFKEDLEKFRKRLKRRT